MLYFGLSFLLQCLLAQDSPGGLYSLGCRISSSATVPDQSSHCGTTFTCESGFYKMTLNSFTPNVRELLILVNSRKPNTIYHTELRVCE